MKLIIFGLHSGFSSKRGSIRSVKSNEFAIPIRTSFDLGKNGHSNILYKSVGLLIDFSI